MTRTSRAFDYFTAKPIIVTDDVILFPGILGFESIKTDYIRNCLLLGSEQGVHKEISIRFNLNSR